MLKNGLVTCGTFEDRPLHEKTFPGDGFFLHLNGVFTAIGQLRAHTGPNTLCATPSARVLPYTGLAGRSL